MSFIRRREKQIETIEEMNQILEQASRYSRVLYQQRWDGRNSRTMSLSHYTWIEDKMVQFEVTTRWAEQDFGVPCTYIIRKDGTFKYSVNPYVAYGYFQRVYKVPDFSESAQANPGNRVWLSWDEERKHCRESAGPLLWNKSDGIDYVYVYDLNSAYGSVLLGSIPDTTTSEMNRMVGEGEVGFMFDRKLSMVGVGEYADIVFKLMDSPYRSLVRKYYEIKRNAPKGSKEREEAKQMINLAVGYWQKVNPFLRSYVVNSCNKFMLDRIDENTIMVNTDAIYSLKPRPDLEMGDDIGQFKLEHEGLMKHRGSNYEINGEVHFRGIPQSWFPENFDIMTDDIPDSGNMYYYNEETNKLEEYNYEI